MTACFIKDACIDASSETHGQSRIVSVCETGRGFPSLSDDGINDIHVIPNLVL